VPGEGIPTLCRDAKRQGRLFFGSFLWSEQRNEQTIFEIFWIPAFAGITGFDLGF